MTAILSKDVYAPYFQVEIEGEKLAADAVISVSVEEGLDAPAKFEIALNEELDLDTQKFRWLDKAITDPGNKVEIFFGYVDQAKKKDIKSLFLGTIKGLTPGFQSNGIPSLRVEGFDLSHSLQKKMPEFNKINVRYSDIVRELAKKRGLGTKNVEGTDKKKKIVERKENEKDYAFIRRMADEVHYEFFVRGKELHFRKPRDKGGKSIRSYKFRQNMISFNPRLTMANLIDEVVVTGFNEKKEKIRESVKLMDIASSKVANIVKKFIKATDGTDPKIVEYKALKSKDVARKKGEVVLKKTLNTFIQGDLECIGDPGIRPGNNVDIEGVGELFSGDYYILSVKNSFDEGGYKTTLSLRRNIN
jgi:phage protein D